MWKYVKELIGHVSIPKVLGLKKVKDGVGKKKHGTFWERLLIPQVVVLTSQGFYLQTLGVTDQYIPKIFLNEQVFNLPNEIIFQTNTSKYQYLI